MISLGVNRDGPKKAASEANGRRTEPGAAWKREGKKRVASERASGYGRRAQACAESSRR
jgi:hypothetical protein